MDKSALLLFCCLVVSLSGFPLYPSISTGRHADAIFTNSYRKVLGQISARKFLQSIMGKRLGDKSVSYVKRQSDIYEGTYNEDLTSIQSRQRYRGLQGNVMRPG
ncbi:Somatoliberin [Liparis tanakae]|uniref:Somatoliberin n=1 Tax=Liparis tanakae TaxID=230148 RepID=A0A4Z2IKP8_9TELE|nr:Somatoliberin [Liparis tanakae]